MHGSKMSPQTFWPILKSATDDEVSQTHQHNVRDGVRGIRFEPNKSTRRSFAFSRLRRGTFIGCRRRQNASGEFRGVWPGLVVANLHLLRTRVQTTERRKPNDQNENARCLDSSFGRHCHASVSSGSRQAGARKPLRFGFTVQPAPSV
jgi:hypothetical protein